jgi:hypothetical protein
LPKDTQGDDCDVFEKLGTKHARLRDLWVKELGALPPAAAPDEMLQVSQAVKCVRCEV